MPVKAIFFVIYLNKKYETLLSYFLNYHQYECVYYKDRLYFAKHCINLLYKL